MKNLVLALLLLATFAPPLLAQQVQPYRLSPNDTLEIHIVGREELTTKQTITPDGTISIPILGRITIVGKTLFELDDLLISGFSKVIKAPSIVTYLIPHRSLSADEVGESPHRSLSADEVGVSKGEGLVFVVIEDVKKGTWTVKEAKTVSEALAWTAGQEFYLNGVKQLPTATLSVQPLIQPGDTVLVKMGEKPTFWEANWYKVLSSLAVVAGIVNLF
jgi:protein involved in polysaccharide export with SLBB domain